MTTAEHQKILTLAREAASWIKRRLPDGSWSQAGLARELEDWCNRNPVLVPLSPNQTESVSACVSAVFALSNPVVDRSDIDAFNGVDDRSTKWDR